MVGYSAMWKASRAARQVARGEEEDSENRRFTFRWDWGRKTCGIVGRDWAWGGSQVLCDTEVPRIHSQREHSIPSQDQVRIHWLLIVPIGFRKEADCGLRHVLQWISWPPTLSPEAFLPWIWHLTSSVP